jgi:small conductance mechanosensitive channel
MLSFLGIDLTAFLMSIGALSIAISFATKDIISNLISGMILYADRPFRIGDVIQVKDCKGRVVRIGVRSTLLETKEGELITIPNSIFLANPVRKLKA